MCYFCRSTKSGLDATKISLDSLPPTKMLCKSSKKDLHGWVLLGLLVNDSY